MSSPRLEPTTPAVEVKKATYFAYLCLDKKVFEDNVDQSFEAMASAKSQANIDIFLKQFDSRMISIYNSKDAITVYGPGIYIKFKCDPNLLNKKFYYSDSSWVFKNNKLPATIKDDIELCVALSTEPSQMLDHIFRSESLFELFRNVCKLFRTDYSAYTYLYNIFPPTSTFDLNEIFKKLGEDVIEIAAINYQDDLIKIIKLINHATSDFKQLLYRQSQEKQIPNAEAHINFLHNINKIETAISYTLIKLSPDLIQENLILPLNTISKELEEAVLNSKDNPSKANSENILARKPRYNPVVQTSNIDAFKFSGKIVEHSVKLTDYPRSHNVPLTNTDCLILGDLHSNAIKLIWFLLHENVIKGISEHDYLRLVQIYENRLCAKLNYYKSKDLPEIKKAIASELAEFHEIIVKITAVNPESIPRIIEGGDNVADRGHRDDFVLDLHEQLNALNIFPRIPVSNHDREFIRVYEEGGFDRFDKSGHLDLFTTELTPPPTSLNNLCKLLQFGLIDHDELIFKIEKIYLPLLIGLDLNINLVGDKVEYTAIMHAPEHIDIMKRVADQFKIDVGNPNTLYTDPEQLRACRDKINDKVRELLREKKFSRSSVEGTALWDLMWKRQTSREDSRMKDVLPANASITYVHGHDGRGLTGKKLSPKITTVDLDNMLGKGDLDEEYTYNAYYLGNNPNFLKDRLEALNPTPKNPEALTVLAEAAVIATMMPAEIPQRQMTVTSPTYLLKFWNKIKTDVTTHTDCEPTSARMNP